MKFKKFIATGATALALIGTVAACSVGSSSAPPQQSAAQKESNAQGQDSNNLINNQPVPVYQSSQERQTLINVEDIQAQGENTTSFGFANNGALIWQCSSIGMPVASSTELTNPHQIVQDPYGGGYNLNNGGQVIDQMDPTGVYSGVSTGTNVLCTSPNGEYIQYWEGYVDTVSGAAVYKNGQVVLLGKPDFLKKNAATGK